MCARAWNIGAWAKLGRTTAVSIATSAAARSVSLPKLNSVKSPFSKASAASACARFGLAGTENSRASNTPNIPVAASYPAAVIRLPSGRK